MPIIVDDSEVKAGLRALKDFGPVAMAETLNKVAFEVLDAEEKEIHASFNFTSGSTARWLGRSLRFIKATQYRLAVTFKPLPKAGSLLIPHIFGETIYPDRRHLTFGGMLAVPVTRNVTRTARGKVPASLLPMRLLGPGGRGFVNASKSAILQRIGRGNAVRVMYILINAAQLQQRFDYFTTMHHTVRKELPIKATQVWNKFKSV